MLSTGSISKPSSDSDAVVMRLTRISTFLLLMATVWGCATTTTPTYYQPASINEVRFRDRALSTIDADIRVSVAVPTAEENQALFSSDLIRREIQPVWVKVENHSARTYYMLSAATDPNYFSPLEVVYSLRGGLFGIYRDEMERHFRSMSFRNPISPHTAVSGFIFTSRRVTPEDADEYRDPSDAFYKLRKEFGGLLEPLL